MHYVRFLKLPKIHVESGSSISIRAVVALTTDLGETFYPDDIELTASVRSTQLDGEIYIRRKFIYSGGSRAVPITINLSRSDVEWPACLHVAVKGHHNQHQNGFLPPFVDIWSSELSPTKGIFTTSTRVERRFTALNGKTVSLLEDAGDSIARHLWDGSQALAHYIDQTINLQHAHPSPLPLLEYVLVSATYRRLNVLELGCGAGTVGISLAQSIPDCDVLLTDLPEAQDLVTANIERMNPAISSRVAFTPLDWEAPPPSTVISRAYDLIIVSECTYNTSTLRPLVGTLVTLTTHRPKAVIVVATKTRHPDEAEFFNLMKGAGFATDSSARIALPGTMGNGYADSARDVGLHVFHGKEHRLSLSPRSGSEEDVNGEHANKASSSRSGSRGSRRGQRSPSR